MLGSMLNLPLWMRHMSDYIMLVALFQSKFMKDNGGLMRLLTGTDTDGKVHSDGMTLAAELCLSHGGGAAIQLPSDTPGAEPEAWCLRIFVLFFHSTGSHMATLGPSRAQLVLGIRALSASGHRRVHAPTCRATNTTP